jgi:DNA-directed RNA polymerase specialized sigma24 family protein
VGDCGASARSRNLVELAELCDAHCRQALGLAYALLADLELAEHAVEEALLTAWRAGATSTLGPEATRLLLRGLVVHQATLYYCKKCLPGTLKRRPWHRHGRFAYRRTHSEG